MAVTDEITRIFDADNHYWESSDAFTRYRDPKYAERGVQVREVDGVLRYVIDGEVFQVLPGPGDVHPRPRPGAFMDYFSGKLSRDEFVKSFNVPPSEHPEWYERDARLAVMDEQGVEAVWLFPSQGVVLEAPMLERDVEATIGVVRAFNRWIEDQWGFAYEDRIFGVPYLNMSDADLLVEELEWCLERGARVVAIRHGSAVTADGLRSPADPMFDRFWGLAQESGVVVSSHDGSDSTYADMYPLLTRVWGDAPELGVNAAGDNMRMMGGGSVIGSLMKNRIVHDFAYILVAHRLNPRDQFVEHCWVAPFVEESVDELARHLPVERILFGSDWPHGEGYPEPKAFFENVANFSVADQRRIMYENARELTFA
jgi:predicted TIM-barrel fold metal-dependent hydrolase